MEVHQVRGARAYYTDVGKRQIGGGLELWQGFFQSVSRLPIWPPEDDYVALCVRSARPSIGQMLINTDISMSTM